MGLIVVMGGIAMCTGGVAPSPLLAISNVLVSNRPALTIFDFIPMLNVMSFGVCLPNLGTPCIPTPPAPWIPFAPTIILGKGPVLTMESKLICARGGIINILFPGQFNILT